MVDVFYYDAFQKTLNPEPEGGPLVRYSDYAALEAQLAKLEAELAKQIEVRDNAIDDLQEKWWFQSDRADRAEALSRTGAVKVAALEWEAREERLLSVPPEKFWRAQTPFDWGYRVKEYGNGFSFGDAVEYPTIEAAKAAAQADYERRALSCLTTEPAAPAEIDEWEGEITDPVEQASADRNRAARIAAAAPEGQQEADAVLASALKLAREYRPTMDKDILHSWASDAVKVIRVLSDRPSEQAVTEVMVKAFQEKYREFWKGSWPDSETSRELLKSAIEAGR